MRTLQDLLRLLARLHIRPDGIKLPTFIFMYCAHQARALAYGREVEDDDDNEEEEEESY